MHCQCSIRLSSSRLCPVHARYHFRKEIVLRNSKNFKTNETETILFFCTTILFLAPLYITLYTWLGPIAIAIVEVMPLGRVMYSKTNKHSSSTLR